jgi:hypothetical protein
MNLVVLGPFTDQQQSEVAQSARQSERVFHVYLVIIL